MCGFCSGEWKLCLSWWSRDECLIKGGIFVLVFMIG